MRVQSLVPVALALLLAAPASIAGLANGDFELDPNTDWLRPGTDAPRHGGGDRPHIARTGTGRFARAGDRDGRGADGESPSRFFQRFRCAGEGGPCRVAFRFRATVGRGEVAWIRLASTAGEHIWRLPGTRGEWKGPVGVEHGECGADLVVDFGIFSTDESSVSGTLDVDDVVSSCGGPPPDLLAPAAPELEGSLPPLTAAGTAEMPLPLILPRGGSGPEVAVLVTAGGVVLLFLLFVLRKARRPGPETA